MSVTDLFIQLHRHAQNCFMLNIDTNMWVCILDGVPETYFDDNDANMHVTFTTCVIVVWYRSILPIYFRNTSLEILLLTKCQQSNLE